MKILTAQEIIEKATNIITLDSQKETILTISTLISMHMRRLQAIHSGIDISHLPRFSQLIIASTGSGKTYLIEQLARAAGVGFSVVDSSLLTFSGYKGVNLAEQIASLRDSFSGPGTFEESIILFDEFDKISTQSDIQNGNPQPNFLKMLEGDSITVADVSCGKGYRKIDTSRMLFIFSGAFAGIEEIIQKRLKPKQKIGFFYDCGENDISDNILEYITTQDVVDYGFSAELIGRIGNIHTIPVLGKKDMMQLIQSGNTSAKSKIGNMFLMSGVEFDISNEAVELIAEKSMEIKTGARAIVQILFEIIQPAFCMIDLDASISKVMLTAENQKFVIEYKKGVRKDTFYKVLAENSDTGYSFADMNISDFICNDGILNNLVKIMKESCKKCNLLNDETYRVFAVFLNLALRFLQTEVNSEEQTFHSLFTLAKSAILENDADESTFDILISDWLKKRKSKVDILKYYYQVYQENITPKTSRQIGNALIRICYEWDRCMK
ncbi:MAG: AAA family ATPase [Peptococcaceae bacterium]|nr:AAA family ATPase [Peptococcaceae bacterium]